MPFRFTALLAGLLSCAIALPAAAQTAPTPAAKPKPAARKPAPKKKAPPPPPEPEVTPPAADAEQLAAAKLIYLGDYACEFSQSVKVVPSTKAEGYIDVDFNKQVYMMKPVLSSTGARRLEDVRGKALMIQIANKSMLMDVQAGRRLVDDCVHEEQRAARLAPPPSDSLGIDPVKAAAAAASAAAAAASAADAAAVAAQAAAAQVRNAGNPPAAAGNAATAATAASAAGAAASAANAAATAAAQAARPASAATR